MALSIPQDAKVIAIKVIFKWRDMTCEGTIPIPELLALVGVDDLDTRVRDIEKHLDDFNGYAPLPRKEL